MPRKNSRKIMISDLEFFWKYKKSNLFIQHDNGQIVKIDLSSLSILVEKDADYWEDKFVLTPKFVSELILSAMVFCDWKPCEKGKLLNLKYNNGDLELCN